MNYDFYYNVDGYFVVEKLKTFLNEPIIFNFGDVNYTISQRVNKDFGSVKNKIIVYGKKRMMEHK